LATGIIKVEMGIRNAEGKKQNEIQAKKEKHKVSNRNVD